MNRDIVEGNWKQFKGRAQARWSVLIGDHLGVITGRRTQVAGARQSAYGVIRSKTLRGRHANQLSGTSHFIEPYGIRRSSADSVNPGDSCTREPLSI